MPLLVTFDLETTGLDPRKDAIIEIGAVRFNGNRVEAEFQTLINPNRNIPQEITQLTGINNEMVRNAPPISAVLQNLVDFVGDCPVIGHNVQFDLGFIQQAGVLHHVESIDTYELASVLMPRASRYNLGALCQQLGVPVFNAHRALDDAMLTQRLFLRLYEMALELPIELLAELVRLSEPLEWDGYWLFQQVLRAKARKQTIQPKHVKTNQFYRGLYQKDDFTGHDLKPNADILPLNEDDVSSILEPGGAFSRYFENYEYRSQQVEMLRNVTMAFSDGYHLMVEAGTGTGKSFAYLIPSALWSYQNNERVVISTNTIALQEQLMKKDIPDLNKALDLDLNAVVLKGRSNYLCPRRFEALRYRGPETVEEMRVLGKVLVWLAEGGNGDRAELNINNPMERDTWIKISAEDENCRAETCTSRMDGICPFYQARQAAQSAHLVVVNHALLLSDVVTGNRVLPQYKYLIIDEGHHLEPASTSALSYRITQNDILRFLRELGGVSSGILGRLLTALKNSVKPSEFAAANQVTHRLTDLAFRLEHDFKNFFFTLEEFLEHARDFKPIGPYAQQVRILPGTRTIPAWSTVEIQYDTTQETMYLLLNLVKQYFQDLGDYQESGQEDLEEAVGSLGTNYQRFSEAAAYLNGMILDPDPNFIYWVEQRADSNKLTLQIAPLHIGSMMEQHLWHEKTSVVLTSATLTTHGEFDYLRGRLNADEADELIVGSPFDYETSTLLYLPNDIPEPTHGAAYQRMIETTLVRISRETGGRMLVLFTSYAQLRKTSQAIAPHLAEHDIQVYEQGEGASANVLLENFRETDKAVLLGTRAFWEGVDIPGTALSVLVIVKLPFAVPSDPIVAARSETFEDPFSEYSIPEAILTFRQGFGRLIRTQYDQGVVVVLDRRLTTKRYGKLFIESLPKCHLQVGTINEVAKKTARWLNL
ncbi:MAG: DNA polymerase III subunit epsilon [Anaerolineaceae bacterium]|nr:DNA polymerase III subunit epsilon [Anaerolineaceae bacterium]